VGVSIRIGRVRKKYGYRPDAVIEIPVEHREPAGFGVFPRHNKHVVTVKLFTYRNGSLSADVSIKTEAVKERPR